MKIGECKDSSGGWLKAEDFKRNGQYVEGALTISGVVMAEFKQHDGSVQRRAALKFHEIEKGLVLNNINVKRLQMLTNTGDDDDTDRWVGVKVTLFVKPDVEFKGDIVPGIRIRVPEQSATAPAAPPPPAAPVHEGSSDDLPF